MPPAKDRMKAGVVDAIDIIWDKRKWDPNSGPTFIVAHSLPKVYRTRMGYAFSFTGTKRRTMKASSMVMTMSGKVFPRMKSTPIRYR